ncbi:MAG: STAS/SEC14 domain-containing protein, partial [Sphingorhabdus sp.]|uniref:STAS/SEC14 domain-containing protein n=1 Tax=Sphingorhabdus sp. TaxID=1902408 RepID=UPI003C94E2D3
MLNVEMDRDAGYLELTVDGRIEKSDFERAVDAIDTLLETHKKIDVMEIILDIGFIEPEVWWKEIVFHLTHRSFLRRVAVVSDNGWVGPLTRLFAPLYPAAIRTYSIGEVFEARQWAKEGDAKAGDAVEP